MFLLIIFNQLPYSIQLTDKLINLLTMKISIHQFTDNRNQVHLNISSDCISITPEFYCQHTAKVSPTTDFLP